MNQVKKEDIDYIYLNGKKLSLQQIVQNQKLRRLVEQRIEKSDPSSTLHMDLQQLLKESKK